MQGRLSVINSSALQIFIRSTKEATYCCKFNDMEYFPCEFKQCNLISLLCTMPPTGRNGDIIANLPPMSYTLMVEATSTDSQNATDTERQIATDTVGPIILTGGGSGLGMKSPAL